MVTLRVVADIPEAYERQDGFELLKNVPVTWDETRFIAGESGEYIVIARRSGDVWYLGGMNNWSARTVDLTLEFLSSDQWELELLHDASLDDSSPNAVAQQTREANGSTRLKLELASGGGFVATVHRK